MKICIVGAGAIGGLLGARLIQAGEEVTLIARGAHLAAIQTQGLCLHETDGRQIVVQPALATADMATAGPQDIVIAAVKAHSLSGLAAPMRALYGSQTAVVTAQNGIPWWYFQRQSGPLEGHRIESVDPGGVIAANLEVERVIGCVVYPAAEITAPGVIRHLEGNRFTLGEPDGTRTERIAALSQALVRAGFKAPVRTNIRTEIWIKLWGNLAFNPISALGRATLGEIMRYAPSRALAQQMMEEGQQVAERLGVEFGISLAQRMRGVEEVGEHRTSMLQDVEAGRPTEVDALVGAVVELGQLVQVPTPTIQAIYAAMKLLERKAMGETL